MPRPLISIILLSYNRVNLTRTAVANLKKAVKGLPVEIIVVDNASTDGTSDFLSGLRDKRFRVVLNKENHFFGGGNNIGLDLAQGEFVLLTQNDFFFAPHSIGLMLDCFRALPNCGMVGVGGGMLTPHTITELTDWYRNPLRRFHYMPVDFISGCCMLAERAFIEKNHIRFDENFRLYWEDVDISHQVTRAGRALYMLHNGAIGTEHLRSASISPLLGEHKREQIRTESHRYYLHKWINVPLSRCQGLAYGMFAKTSNLYDAFSMIPISDELQDHDRDIERIQKLEFLEMEGAFDAARTGLNRIWEDGRTNYMALRNLCRLRRTTGDMEELTAVVALLRAELKCPMPELFRDKLIKHYQLGLEQLAEGASKQNRLSDAVTYWTELLNSARAKSTKDKCLEKIFALTSKSDLQR